MCEPYRSELLRVDDIHQVFFACYGNCNGKPVFVFHGGPGYGFSYDMLEPFDLEDWNVIAIDQRGCRNSRPLGCVQNNTTDLLVEDVRKVAKYLDISRFTIKGESWGSTLALVYAEKYPEDVRSMILTGVFLGDNHDTLLGKYGGFENYYPEYWDQYIKLLPEEKRTNPYEAYYEYLMNGNSPECERYARQLVFLELITEMTMPDVERANRICDSLDCCSIARIESYYTMNDFFLEDGIIERNIERIKHIPITIVQGRHDLIVPIKSAWKLAQLLPESEMIICEMSGHSDSSEQTSLILKDVVRRHGKLSDEAAT